MLLSRLQPFWDFMASPPFVPQAYWDAVSNEQRIKYLFARLYRLCEYANELSKNQDELTTAIEQMRAELDDKMKQLDEDFAALEDALQKNLEEELLALEQRLKNLINDLQVAQGWDVESGQATSAKESMRILRGELYNSSTVNELKKNFSSVVDMAHTTFIPKDIKTIGKGRQQQQSLAGTNMRVDQLSTRLNSLVSLKKWMDSNGYATDEERFNIAAQLTDFYTYDADAPYKWKYTWPDRHNQE